MPDYPAISIRKTHPAATRHREGISPIERSAASPTSRLWVGHYNRVRSEILGRRTSYLGQEALRYPTMIVVLHLSSAETENLSEYLEFGNTFTAAVPKGSARTSGAWQLCILTSEATTVASSPDSRTVVFDPTNGRNLIALARLRISQRPQTTHDRVKVSEATLIEPIPLSHLTDALPADKSSILDVYPAFTVGDRDQGALLEALLRLNPSLSEIISTLRRSELQIPITGTAGETLALEGDAERLAMRIAGLDTTPLTDGYFNPGDGHLKSLRYEPPEDVLIAHDAARLPDWKSKSSNAPDWLLFSDGQQHIRIGNVNRTPLESVLGVDLIYRHIEANTFILVQYKKMAQDHKSQWFYRPDHKLYDQLGKMSQIASTTD